MPKKTFTPEQIVGKLRQIEVLLSQGKTVPQACKEAGIVEQTFYRWRREYGGTGSNSPLRGSHSVVVEGAITS
jgi:transposase-like protein